MENFRKKALASASAFFNEAHLRCMKNDAGLSPDFMGLNLRLQLQVEKIKPLIYCINERCVL